MICKVIAESHCKDGMGESFVWSFRASFPDTRSLDVCLQIDLSADEENSNHSFMTQEWKYSQYCKDYAKS